MKYVIDMKRLMSHRYPNSPSTECYRRRGEERSGDIEVWQRKRGTDPAESQIVNHRTATLTELSVNM